MLDKAELRQNLRAARLALRPDQVTAKSVSIVEHLKQLIMEAQPAVVHCFEPMKGKHEVNVTPIVKFLQSLEARPLQYTSRKINGWWQVVALDGQAAYRQPVFDFVIVPMLGFDEETLHRLGNGGGYYDRMLSRQVKALKIGVCFELGKLADFPATSHDIALDCIVTEERIYTRPGVPQQLTR